LRSNSSPLGTGQNSAVLITSSSVETQNAVKLMFMLLLFDKEITKKQCLFNQSAYQDIILGHFMRKTGISVVLLLQAI
jgi:hypothetical protein